MKNKKVLPEQLLRIPSWDEQFMHDVYWWARRSKDPRTKIGAVLVRWEDKIPISMAYNSFSRKVDDTVLERWERPEKYEWVIKLNAAFYIVDGYRNSFINGSWFWENQNLTLYYFGLTIFWLAFGALVFKRLRPHFGDVL